MMYCLSTALCRTLNYKTTLFEHHIFFVSEWEAAEKPMSAAGVWMNYIDKEKKTFDWGTSFTITLNSKCSRGTFMKDFARMAKRTEDMVS